MFKKIIFVGILLALTNGHAQTTAAPAPQFQVGAKSHEEIQDDKDKRCDDQRAAASDKTKKAIALCTRLDKNSSDDCNNPYIYQTRCLAEEADFDVSTGDDKPDYGNAVKSLNVCPQLATSKFDKDSKKGLRDLRKESRDLKRECTDKITENQQKIQENQNTFANLPTKEQDARKLAKSKSQEDIGKLSTESIKLDSEIARLRDIESQKIASDQKSVSEITDNKCMTDLLVFAQKTEQDMKNSGKYNSSLNTPGAIKKAAISAGLSTYKICMETNQVAVAQAERTASIKMAETVNDLQAAVRAKAAMNMQIMQMNQRLTDDLSSLSSVTQSERTKINQTIQNMQKAIQIEQDQCKEEMKDVNDEIADLDPRVKKSDDDDSINADDANNTMATQLRAINKKYSSDDDDDSDAGDRSNLKKKYDEIGRKSEKIDKDWEDFNTALGDYSSAWGTYCRGSCPEAKGNDICADKYDPDKRVNTKSLPKSKANN